MQVLYPNPVNPDRYVWVVAATSADGMYFADFRGDNVPDWDYVVADGRFPAFGQGVSALQTRVVSGMFDSNWRFSVRVGIP